MSEAASLSRDQNKANNFALTFIDSFSDKRVISMPSILEYSNKEFDVVKYTLVHKSTSHTQMRSSPIKKLFYYHISANSFLP